MAAIWHFPAFILVSLAAFAGILHISITGRRERPRNSTVLAVAAIVVVGGMVFAKAGAAAGLPVAAYYGLPAALTWVLPPWVFRMSSSELVRYLPLAMISAPAIHLVFSFFLGWHEYLPFMPVPSLQSILRRG